MRRGIQNAVVDTILLVVFVPSPVLYFVLPSGGRGAGTFLSVQRSTWATVHDYAGLLFIALLVLHLVLHYRYLRHLDRHLAGSRGTSEGEGIGGSRIAAARGLQLRAAVRSSPNARAPLGPSIIHHA
ncbi:MAG: DUF4405 domain-containing protein [Methanospirillum sp.]